MKTKSLLLICVLALFTLSGCLKPKSDKNLPSVPFSYKGQIKEGKRISIKFHAAFNSQAIANVAKSRKASLKHALNMTLHQYSSKDLSKKPRVRIFLTDVLNQLFKDSVKSVQISYLDIQ